jgi:glycosyltransferase involved in cell wall biosynthesis
VSRGPDAVSGQRRILVLSPYDVFPARYGGTLRTFHLCRELSRHFEVRQFAQQVQRGAIALTLAPRVERSSATYVQHSSRNPGNIVLFWLTAVVWRAPPVWQSGMLRAAAPRWLRREIESADLVQVEQPWQFAWAHRQVAGRKPIVLNTQNVEADIFGADAMRGPRALARRLAAAATAQEAFAVRHATRVLTATPEDAEALGRRYGSPAGGFTVVPNGVDCAGLVPVDEEQRRRSKAALGLEGRRVALFVASVSRSNLEAANLIAQWARAWPDRDVCFVVAGSVGEALAAAPDSRLRLTGRVADIRPYLEAADVGLNPMRSGSGSNLKLLESMAMGLPTVTTAVGARGVPVADGVHAYVSPEDAFPARLRAVLEDVEGRRAIGRAARQLVAREFDWRVIVERALPLYRSLLGEA